MVIAICGGDPATKILSIGMVVVLEGVLEISTSCAIFPIVDDRLFFCFFLFMNLMFLDVRKR